MMNLAETSTHFGERLKSERIRLGFTQEDLAVRVDLKPLAILQYEKSKSSPSLKTLYAFEGAGLNLSFLIFGVVQVPDVHDFHPSVIKTTIEVVRQFDELYKKEGGLTEEARIKLILMLLKKIGHLKPNEPKPEFNDFLKNLLPPNFGVMA